MRWSTAFTYPSPVSPTLVTSPCTSEADPFLPPRNKVVLKRGKPYHYMKLAFERFYLEKVKRDLPGDALRLVEAIGNELRNP